MGLMHKSHPDLGHEHLSLRSYMHHIRHLCQKDDNAMVRHSMEAIARLEKQQPRKVRARSMFVSDVVGAIQRRAGSGSAAVTYSQMQAVMTSCSEEYNALPERAAMHYEGLAQVRQQRMAAHRDSEIVFYREQLARAQEHEAAELAERGLQHRLSQFRFTDDDWVSMAEIWNSQVASLRNPNPMVNELYKSEPEPVGERLRQLRAAKPRKLKQEKKSDFVRLIAGSRFFFQGMVFMVEEPDQTVAFRLLFAFQKPLRAYFLPLFTAQSELPFLPADMDLMARAKALRNIFRFEFQWLPCTYITDKGWSVDNFKNIWVFQDLQWQGQRRCGTSLMPMPLSEFADRQHLST